MLKIASWNVNSLTIRLEQVLSWLEATKTDILALQETKLVDEKFPVEAFQALGYAVAFSGQKTYNGVAIISRLPILDIIKSVPDYEDPQRRLIAATLDDLRLINLYVPNGAAPGTDKYEYKLAWLKTVTEFIRQQLAIYPRLVVLGDFNIAPADLDVHEPSLWEGQVLVSEPERAAFKALLDLGLDDSFRVLYPELKAYSWWDYRSLAFPRNNGLRIDHILLSQKLMENCKSCNIDREARKAKRPSDHAPITATISS